MHVHDDLLRRFVDGALDDEVAASVAIHLDSCSRCATRAATLEPLALAFAAVDDPVAPADEQLASAEKRRLVHAALARLSPEQRAVFVLCELEGLTMPEASAELGINLNTAYSRLRLAREAFVKAVRALREEGGRS